MGCNPPPVIGSLAVSQLTLRDFALELRKRHNVVLVPISGLQRAVIEAVNYARSLSDDVRALYVDVDPVATEDIDNFANLGLTLSVADYGGRAVLNYRYGIEDAPRWPYAIAAGERALTEFPISTWRLAGRNLPIAGGAYFRIYPYALTRMAFRSISPLNAAVPALMLSLPKHSSQVPVLW